MIKHYTFDYDLNEAQACFKVDTNKFTKEIAQENIDFFLWDYDKEADPIDEVMKKYAMEVIKVASTYNYNLYGIKREFEQNEGFVRLDGSLGIELNFVSAYEFDDEKLEVTIVED
jgi:hypothetical protein